MSVHVICVCPCCASPVDALSGESPQELACLACDQRWTMIVDQVRHAAHSLT